MSKYDWSSAGSDGAATATAGAPPAKAPDGDNPITQARGGVNGPGPAVGDAPKGGVSLDLSDPAKIRAALGPAFGPAIAEMVAEGVATQMKTLGLDRVDRRYLSGLPDVASGRSGGPKHRLGVMDLHDRSGWEIPQIRATRLYLLRGFFRMALFGTHPDKALEGFEYDDEFLRVLSSTDAAGGVLIPPGFVPELVRDMPKLSALHQYVRKIPVASNSGTMPAVSTNATVYWGTENVTIDEGDPSFTEATYSINRMNALVKLSREIASDANPDIVQVVTELFQEAMARERDKVIAIGTGSGRPLGLYSASGIIDVSSVTTLTYANIVNLKESVDQRYQSDPSFRWHFNQNVKAAVMKLVDLEGLPIFVPARQSNGIGEMATILGTPFSIESSFPNNYIGIGCLRYYMWFDRQEMGLERTTEGGDAFAKHQLWIKLWERVDGKPVLPPTKPMARSRVVTGVTTLT